MAAMREWGQKYATLTESRVLLLPLLKADNMVLILQMDDQTACPQYVILNVGCPWR